ncbi:MAG: ribonuclease HII, partial [Lachnospiraceae bacterium]|nr:ribonuclease HII [Lachnospiraceae bacterium]
TKEAMVKALRRLLPGAVAEDPEKRNEEARVKPDLLLIDALHLSSLPDIKQVSIIKGDEKSVSIAAASILAKVKRDHLMEKYAQIYPVYGFASNKGYGTEAHREAILKYGPCPIHRRTFIGNLV